MSFIHKSFVLCIVLLALTCLYGLYVQQKQRKVIDGYRDLLQRQDTLLRKSQRATQRNQDMLRQCHQINARWEQMCRQLIEINNAQLKQQPPL